jgi:hypothetical protein
VSGSAAAAGQWEKDLVEIQVDGAQVLVGVFGDQQGAERAVKSLHDAGFDSSQINLLSKGDNTARQMVESALPPVDTEPEGTRVNVGTLIGLLSGAAAGVATGLGIINFPGLEGIPPPVAMAVCGVILAILGAWGGTLAGMPIPEEDVSYFTGDLDRGAFLVAIRTSQIDEAIDVLGHAGARNFETMGVH